MAFTNDSPTAIALFNRIDREGLGYLGRAEVTELSVLLGLQLSASEVDDVIACMDTDNDGVVAQGEFKSWWKVRLTVCLCHQLLTLGFRR